MLGTRFKTEKCYDRAGVEKLLQAQRGTEEMLERMRNCATGSCPTG